MQEEVEIIENARRRGVSTLAGTLGNICNETLQMHNVQFMNSLTALHVATMNNNLDVVTLLLKYGALVETTEFIEATDSVSYGKC